VTTNDSVFNGSIPEIYDEYLVPLIFEDYADDLADRVVSVTPTSVLELAAGSGVVTRALAPRLSPSSRYMVTDLNQSMLNRASSVQPPDDRIEWRQADALDLPFDDDSFDVVVCQFSVMFFPDKVAGYSEARRVLRPGGLFVFNVWDDIESNVFSDLVTQAAVAEFPDDPPMFLARTPHGYHDIELIRADVKAAGFSDISIETLEKVSSAPTARHPAIGYAQGTPLRNEIEALGPSALELVTERASQMLAARFGDGPVSASMRGHVVSAS
jgi:ubiquinone/menaquinone biosynthesis C-methylase UbiE